jgi:hypothetical protein
VSAQINETLTELWAANNITFASGATEVVGRGAARIILGSTTDVGATEVADNITQNQVG